MKILPSVLVAALCSAAVTLHAQKVTLKINNGQKMTQASVLTNTSSFSVMGNDMTNSSNVDLTHSFAAEGQADNNFGFTIATTRIKLEGTAMSREMSYDSDKKDNDGQLAEVLGKMVNNPKTYTIDNNGTITKQPQAAKTEEEGTLGMLLGSGASMDATPENLYITSMLNRDIKVGTTWMDSTETKENMTVKTVNTYTVTAVEKDMATVSLVSNQGISGTISQMGQEMQFSGTNKTTGTIKVSMLNGIIMEKMTKTESNSTVDASGMTIPISGNSTAKITTTIQ